MARTLVDSLASQSSIKCSSREELEYIANTLVFVLSGVIIAGKIYVVESTTSTVSVSGPDYGYLILLWVYLLVRSKQCWSGFSKHRQACSPLSLAAKFLPSGNGLFSPI